MTTKSTTLYLGDQRLTVRLPIDLWRQLGQHSLATKDKGNTLIVNLLIKHYGTGDLAEIHGRLIAARYDPEQALSANSIIVNLLTAYFLDNPA